MLPDETWVAIANKCDLTTVASLTQVSKTLACIVPTSHVSNCYVASITNLVAYCACPTQKLIFFPLPFPLPSVVDTLYIECQPSDVNHQT